MHPIRRFALVAACAVPLCACGGAADEEPGVDPELLSAAAATYQPDTLDAALAALDAWLREHNPVAAAALRPGLDDEEIDRLTADLPCHLPLEARRLYRWRDGSPPGAPPLFWRHRFIGLEEAAATYRERVAAGGDPAFAWDPAWFPLFDAPGEHYVIACPRTRQVAGPVWFKPIERRVPALFAASLTRHMQTVAAWHASGAVTVADSATGRLDATVFRLLQMHQDLNPGGGFPFDPREP